jgi:hypothetical protein
MKKTNLFIKLIAAVLVACMATVLFAGCGKSSQTVVMSFEKDGKTYTISEQEFDMLMKIRKRVFFCNLLYTTSKDTASFWAAASSEDKDKTNEVYYKELVMDQVKAVLVEKYLFESLGLSFTQDKLDSFKTGIKTAEKEQGGKGAYKQYYGYTAKANYEIYEPMVARSEMLLKELCKEGATLAVTAENLKSFYEEHFVGYQYIVLDMKNRVVLDENGNRVVNTKKNDKGEDVPGDSYKTEKLDSAKEEDKKELEKKQNLGASILKELENKTITFEEAIAKYSDEYYSVEYAEGWFVDKEGTFINSTVTDKVKDLEIGETFAEVITSGDYQYIVKRIDLKAGVYEEFEKDANGEVVKDENGKEVENKYYEFFTDFKSTVEYDKYEKYVESFFGEINVVTEITDKYTMAKTFLSPYVDYYYQMILYYYYGIQM